MPELPAPPGPEEPVPGSGEEKARAILPAVGDGVPAPLELRVSAVDRDAPAVGWRIVADVTYVDPYDDAAPKERLAQVEVRVTDELVADALGHSTDLTRTLLVELARAIGRDLRYYVKAGLVGKESSNA